MIEFIIISSSITSLIILDKYGKISVNTNIIKIITSIYLIKKLYTPVIMLLEKTLIKQ